MGFPYMIGRTGCGEHTMQVWWCNQGGSSWADELENQVVCAAESTRDEFRKSVFGVRTGDVILHYRKQAKAIIAVSVAQSNGVRCVKGDKRSICLYGEGWAARTRYYI